MFFALAYLYRLGLSESLFLKALLTSARMINLKFLIRFEISTYFLRIALKASNERITVSVKSNGNKMLHDQAPIFAYEHSTLCKILTGSII